MCFCFRGCSVKWADDGGRMGGRFFVSHHVCFSLSGFFGSAFCLCLFGVVFKTYWGLDAQTRITLERLP